MPKSLRKILSSKDIFGFSDETNTPFTVKQLEAIQK